MHPKYHTLFGLIFAGIIFLAFPKIGFFGFFTIWASSVLIDVDHHLFYGIIKKDWSVKNSNKWFHKQLKQALKLPRAQRKKTGTIPMIFHGVEAILILILLTIFLPTNFSALPFFILIGFIIHNSLDAVYAIKEGFPLDHIKLQSFNILKYLKQKNQLLFL